MKKKEPKKSVVIEGLEMPTGEDTFIDIRIQSDGKAIMPGCMGHCTVFKAHGIEETEIV